LHAHSERFDHRALFERDVIGQFEGEGGRMNHRAREAAVNRRRRPERDLGIDIIDAEPRRLGPEVWHARLHADPIANFQRMNVGAGLDHRA
jgi:hypothetical protein